MGSLSSVASAKADTVTIVAGIQPNDRNVSATTQAFVEKTVGIVQPTDRNVPDGTQPDA